MFSTTVAVVVVLLAILFFDDGDGRLVKSGSLNFLVGNKPLLVLVCMYV